MALQRELRTQHGHYQIQPKNGRGEIFPGPSRVAFTIPVVTNWGCSQRESITARSSWSSSASVVMCARARALALEHLSATWVPSGQANDRMVLVRGESDRLAQLLPNRKTRRHKAQELSKLRRTGAGGAACWSVDGTNLQATTVGAQHWLWHPPAQTVRNWTMCGRPHLPSYFLPF